MMGTSIRHATTCPHDCPSVCSLEAEFHDTEDGPRLGRVYGARGQSYTDGVICAKVARYRERLYHPERLLYPLRRSGPKGQGDFTRISWDEALAEIGERFLAAEQKFGSETVWPYYYAGTMGRLMRDGIWRLTHAKKYSGMHGTICINAAWPGFMAGTGRIAGIDPREMRKADCIVFWGTNAVATQINAMAQATKARKERAIPIVAIDIYQNATMKQADMALCLRPGTDGALACAVMHVLFRDGLADRDYLARWTDDAVGLEQHLLSKTPEWAAAITGLSVAEIEAFAHLIGRHKRTFFRLGYGFSRQRNGAVNMHAALCVPTVTGAWQYEGGGALNSNSALFGWDMSLIEGSDLKDPKVRHLDQSRIGAVLCGDQETLLNGPPVTAMLIQNTNPMVVAPDQNRVRAGFLREDLFTVVHEQFMTETAAMADIVLPATMFLEHDDLYSGGSHTYVSLGPKVIEPPGECRSNHQLICDLAARVGAQHPGFHLSAAQMVAQTVERSGYQAVVDPQKPYLDVAESADDSHYRNGFHWPDGRFRFRVDWHAVKFNGPKTGDWSAMPHFPDYWPVNELADAAHPFRLATSPAHNFLNSSFNQTPSSLAREGRPNLLIHPLDAIEHAIEDGMRVEIGNQRGAVLLHAKLFDGLQRRTLISEGLWPNGSFERAQGINSLTGAEPIAPFGGAAFHDIKVWLRPA